MKKRIALLAAPLLASAAIAMGAVAGSATAVQAHSHQEALLPPPGGPHCYWVYDGTQKEWVCSAV